MGIFDKLSGLVVASGFKLQGKAPLDPRTVVETLEDRNALITENGAYEGMKVYVKETKTEYQLKGTTNDDWTVGAGSITVTDEIEEGSDLPITSGAIYEAFKFLEEI